MHDCRVDSRILYQAAQVKLDMVFDTQVAFFWYSLIEFNKCALPVSLKALSESFPPQFSPTN